MTEVDGRVVALLHDARHALEEERRRRSEPIAIVGIGCRFPGRVSSPDQYWRMLRDGVDATADVPNDRWDADALYDPDPDVPGKVYVKRGAFLDDITGFEPEFFGISPREAVGLDPQQRLLLEVSWEALEDAGIAPSALNGTATGVWVGQSLDDYARRASSAGNLASIDPYSVLGTARSVAAGRIAYVLGLNGPVMQVDTSCSSSLVAVHLACQSLRAGECDIALVGGVNLMASPEISIALCKLRALSRDGRCKTFDASADGYGRGEGCGIIVLKRVSDAVAASDRIYAEVRGSALNHDGRSNGLTAPNGAAQEAVLRRALANAGFEPEQVQYVEAHGTGTLLGDPIEVLALNRVFGVGRSPHAPLYIGSAKTNISHLEAAAGIAALIKVALSIAHGHIPPHLHLNEPNPKIPWRELPFRVPREVTQWPSGAPRVAGVSSFGMSGTNAHVVVAQASAEPRVPLSKRSAALVVLSARSPNALSESALRLSKHLAEHQELGLHEVAATLAMGRSSLERRFAQVCSSRAELEAALAALAEGRGAGSDSGVSSGRRRGLAWLFPGQGAQQVGMGRLLSREFSKFRDCLDQAFAAIDPHLDRPLADVMWTEAGAGSSALLQQTAYAQPALFAFGWALAGLWRSFGIAPQWVAGHSIGEITAACVAEMFSLSDAARLVCARGRLMQALPLDGAMIAVELDADDAARVIEAHTDRVAIAAVNAPGSVVLSGDRMALQRIAQILSQIGVVHKSLAVSHAFHSPLVDPMLEAFAREASSIDYRAPRIPIVSNVTGSLAGPELRTPAYWVQHVREPVRFAAGIQALYAEGARTFFEMGPRAVLSPLVERTITADDVVVVPSGRSGRSETATLLDAVGTWWREGGVVTWSDVFGPSTSRCSLPTYAWQRKRYWQDVPTVRADNSATLLGTKLESAAGDTIFEALWSSTHPEWVSDHRVGDRVFVPGAAIAELVRAAAESMYGSVGHVRTLSLEKAIVLDEGESTRVQVLVTRGGSQVGIYSRTSEAPEAPWTQHATAEIGREAPLQTTDEALPQPEQLDELRLADFYARLEAMGLNYGPSFRVIERLWSGPREAIGDLRLPEGLEATRYGLHPALLDGAFQVAAAIGDEPLESSFLPVAVDGFRVIRRGVGSARADVRLIGPRTPDAVTVSIVIADRAGIVATIDSVVFRRVQLDKVARTANLYELKWRLVPAPPSSRASETWTLVETSCGARLEALARSLRERGANCTVSVASGLSPDRSVENVVCCWHGDGSIDAALEVASEALQIAQAILSSGERPRLWWVTRGAVSVLPDEVSQPGLAAIWGLGRTLKMEHPELGCTLIDVDDAANLSEVLTLESTASDGEDQVAWRGAARYALRLSHLPPQRRGTPRDLRLDGTVLITGGLGALGMQVASSLAQRGVKSLILASRRRPESSVLSAQLDELKRLGTNVVLAEVDVCALDQLHAVIGRIPDGLPLRGVIHAAGLLDDGVWLEQDRDRLKRVMSPKVLGAWNLHHVTRGADIDMFVMFSSIAGTLGSAGQAGYAAANACLDALADHRRALGLPAQSLAFGPWEVGLAAKLTRPQRDRLTRQGIGFLSADAGRVAFESALERAEAALVVADLRRVVIARSFGDAVPALWRDLMPVGSQLGTHQDGGTQDWTAELSELTTDAERLERLTRLVTDEAGRILSIPRGEGVSLQQPLGDLGMDSLMTLELRRDLARRSGVASSGLLVTGRSTVASVATSLLDLMQRGPGEVGTPEMMAAGRCLQRLSRPRARLFCFHYAGGAAEIFEPFDELAELGIEVHTVSHLRAKPASAATARQYLSEATEYIAGQADVPYALFGHSLGGLIACRVLQELLARAVPAPRLFIPSAAAFPDDLAGDFSHEALARAYRTIVGDRGMSSDSLLADFISDTLLWRELPAASPEPLPIRIAAFVGRTDHIASEPAMRLWAKRTSADFSLTTVAGDHFYLSETAPRRAMFAELIRQLLGTS